jgi:ATP-binding cassette subfamily B protein
MATRVSRALLQRIFGLVRAERNAYAKGFAFVAIGLVTGLTFPQVVRVILDEAIAGGRLGALDTLALVLLGILVLEGVATCCRDYYFNLGAERAVATLRRSVFEHLLAQDVTFFDSRNTGEIATRLSGDAAALQWVLGEELADALRFTVFVGAGIALLFYTSPPLTLLTLLAMPPIAFAMSRLGDKVRSFAAEAQDAHAEAGAAATEVIGGIRTVKAFSQEAAEASRYSGLLVKAVELARRKIRANAMLDGVSFASGECAALLGLWAGGRLIIRGELTPGALVSFVLYATLVAKGFRSGSRFIAISMRAIGASEWIFSLLAQRQHMQPGDARPARLDGTLVLDGVRFRYPTRPDVEVLKGIDLRLEEGEVVAVVGPSGAGKSTLLNLVLRFYDPSEGQVRVGGHDVRTLHPELLRQHVAVVLQEPTLFSRSVAENIDYGSRHASLEAVKAVAALARVDAFVEPLQDGWRTPVGDRGVQLSGGQRQRIAIARALLGRPRILVLDEATSALDSEVEAAVQRSLAGLDYRPTTIVIAHRLSTVLRVDRVLVLDEGRIVDSGSHGDLMSRSRFYRQLVDTQLAAVS